MSDQKKKNKYDLDYNKYCQFFNTTIIILATFFIGFLLSILTKQIEIGVNTPFIFVISTFIVILSISVYFLIEFYNKMKEIMGNIDKLKI